VNRVDVTVTHTQPPEDPEYAEHVCRRILSLLHKDGWELSVLLTDDETVRKLNKEYRGIDKPTDILSFSQLEGGGLPGRQGAEYLPAGDLVISLDTLHENSARSRVTPREELTRLLIHGILHLAGFEHNEEDPRDRMLSLQENILRELLKEKTD
jgi:probable rRNA maturation factor